MSETNFPITFEIETDPTFNSMSNNDPLENTEKNLVVRLDKWLWAARFFRTRPLARAAVKHGKVFYNGHKANPGREIAVGDTVKIILGMEIRTVVITELCSRRRNEAGAKKLYQETQESVELRLRRQAERQQDAALHHRPSYPQPSASNEYAPAPRHPSPSQQERRPVRYLRRRQPLSQNFIDQKPQDSTPSDEADSTSNPNDDA